MKFSKRHLTLISLIVFILLNGCNNKCGEDVLLGNYEVTTQSKEDWFPYVDVETLTFVNDSGITISLDLVYSNSEMIRKVSKIICEKGESFATEYYECEFIQSGYEERSGDTFYFLSISLEVADNQGFDFTDELILYDVLSINLYVGRDDYGGNEDNSCQLYMLTDKRGYNFNIANMPYLNQFGFSNEMTLNGKTFHDVWVGSNLKGIPALFLEQGKGVIAFVGLNDEVWVLQ